jgi:DNA polymerase
VSLKLDWETRGVRDLIQEGAYRYAEHHHTDALMASYKIGSGPLRRWKRGQPCPDDIRAHVEAGGEIKAHNAAFERLIWWLIMAPRHGWPRPRLEQFRCTAVTAAALSLPRSLDRLGVALDLKHKKGKEGKALIKLHSTPQGFTEDGEPIWNEDPASLEKFALYCDDDVLAEEEADERLMPLSDYEQKVYWLNERINDRGIRLDVKSARAAMKMIVLAKERINIEIAEITGKAVTACTQTAAMKRWIEAQGVFMPSMDKDDVEEFLHAIDLPERVKRVLELRQEGAKPSVEKIAAMLQRTCDDGRIRGVYLDHGAGQTGRFSSRGAQLHNMPKYRKIFENAKPDLALLFEHIRSGDPRMVELMYDNTAVHDRQLQVLGRPLHLLSDAVRGFLWAAPGHEFIDIDYSSIESVLGAWIVGEEWKLDAYRAINRGEGVGMYELAAAAIYGIDISEVTKLHRPVGKLSELSCQYQTGVGGIRKFARQNKVLLPPLFPALWKSADETTQEGVAKRFEERVTAHDPNTDALGREGWIAAELIKLGWRAKNPAFVAGWKLLEDAATGAVTEPGAIYEALGAKYRVAHGFLWCLLPSGRTLAYGRPKIEDVVAPWADMTLPAAKRERKRGITVVGVDAVTEKWTRRPIYGGALFNNYTQGAARDVLVHGMFNVEAHGGYPIVLHTHDEMAAEVPRGYGSIEEMAALANDLPAWCRDLPLKASGWRGKRYRKD